MKKFFGELKQVYRHAFMVTTLLIVLFSSLAGGGVQMINSKASYAVDAATTRYAKLGVNRGYLVLLDRQVDPSGQKFWYSKLIKNPDAKWFAGEVMKSPEYKRSTLYSKNNTDFINIVYSRAYDRSATSAEKKILAQSSRSQIAGFVIEHGFSGDISLPKPVQAPQYEICKGFKITGIYNNVKPVCQPNSVGNTRSQLIKAVPGTNIRVNQAWYKNITDLRSAALKAGFNLQGFKSSSVPGWMVSPGSWRSWDDQSWLYSHGYPANRPGNSVHEWGLAIDFTCNSTKSISTNRACWNWLRANGGRYNVHNFNGVNSPSASESWHFSANSK